MDAAEFVRWYGAWNQTTPTQAAAILDGVAVRWWVVGGWAIKAFTGQPRAHEDLDLGVFRSDLPAVLDHLLRDYCVWSNISGSLRPLRAPADLPEECRHVWVRRDAVSPWLVDLLLTPHAGDDWISVRDARLQRHISESLFARDGIRYLRPEQALHMKARDTRPKDAADFEAALGQLDAEACMWLRAALLLTNPDHSWLAHL